MDWLTILNQCLDIILPAVASVIAVLLGVLGTKIKQLYNEKVKDETVRVVVDNVVKWAEQVYKDADGDKKLQEALDKASTLLNEKGIEVSSSELNMYIESAVYALKQGIVTAETLDTTQIEELPEAIETTETTENVENKE